MSEELQDEITSINSIYGATTLQPLPDQSLSATTHIYYTLTHPSAPSISLRLAFPPDYPAAPPSILGTHSIVSANNTTSSPTETAKGDGTALVEITRHVLAEIYTPSVPCIYDLVEESRSRIEQQFHYQQEQQQQGGRESPPDPSQQATQIDDDDDDDSGKDDSSWGVMGRDGADGNGKGWELDGVAPQWVVSDVVVEKKSVFVARAVGVESVETAKRYLGHLLGTDKKVAKATHNITAWRIRGENGVQFQDCDDDGETAAGGRVLHLLELMGVWNAMVVVTRWYGGVQLGPDRFRIINQTARDAVVKGGFAQEGTGKDSTGKKKGKKG